MFEILVLFFNFSIMNNNYLISLLLLFFFVKGYTQNLKIEDLTKMQKLHLVDFQEYMHENQFLFYQANKNETTKNDTILFVNKQNVIAGFIASKKENTVFLENIKEEYFQELNNDLKKLDFVLVDAKVKAKNILEKTYINRTTEKSIEVSIISDVKEPNQIKNTYKVMFCKPAKNIFRKYASRFKN